MGNWQVTIHGVGTHDGPHESAIERKVATFVQELQAGGHKVELVTVCSPTHAARENSGQGTFAWGDEYGSDRLGPTVGPIIPHSVPTASWRAPEEFDEKLPGV
jgi:hypothetical protein